MSIHQALAFALTLIYCINLNVANTNLLEITNETNHKSVNTISHIKKPIVRIIGGKPARPKQFPYHVGLKIRVLPGYSKWCGGSLIDKNWILTVAHSLYSNKYELQPNGSITMHKSEYELSYELVAFIGGYNLNRKDEFQQIYVYSDPNFIIHEHYDPRYYKNDIALVHLPEQAKLNDFAQIIYLPPANIGNLENEMVLTTGWGVINEKTEESASILQYVNLKIININVCKNKFPSMNISDSQICIDGSEMKNICEGDSGGPNAYSMKNGKNIIVGISSYGSVYGCGARYPSVLTNVSYYLDWIVENKQKLL